MLTSDSQNSLVAYGLICSLRGFPKSSWTNVIWFKITALLSGKHNNIFIQSMIMYMYKNQSILYWSYHYLNIAFTVRTPSLTLTHNDVSITSYSWIYLKVICCIHRFVRGYNRILHQNIAWATFGQGNSNHFDVFPSLLFFVLFLSVVYLRRHNFKMACNSVRSADDVSFSDVFKKMFLP